MPPRFYAPDLDLARSDVTLPASESLHLTKVLRLRAGAEVEVFDGRGVLAHGTVRHASTSGVTITVDGVRAAQPEAPHPLAVCASLLKGDAMDAVVRDATVLGSTQIVPMITTRTNVPLARASSGRLHERWQRVAVAAAKQCGRARLPDIAAVQSASAAFSDTAWHAWQRRVLVEPSISTDPVRAAEGPSAGPLVLAFGPEGGWADVELDAARAAGWEAWSLGPFTLRAEHVTLAALSVVRYAWGG